MKTVKNYLNRFFEEKELENVNYSIMDANGSTHIFDNEALIERIKITSPTEQNQIATVLRKIDMVNGNVQSFMKFLAYQMAKQWTN